MTDIGSGRDAPTTILLKIKQVAEQMSVATGMVYQLIWQGKSAVRKDGVRVTSAWRMVELSVVDQPSNSACRFDVVKMLATEDDIRDFDAAVAVEALASTLLAGCRPLPDQLNVVFSCLSRSAGIEPIRCDSTQTRDYSTNGPEWGGQLMRLAGGLRVAQGADAAKIGAACADS